MLVHVIGWLIGFWLGLSIVVFIVSVMFLLNNDTEFFDYLGIKTFGGMIVAILFPWILILRLSPKLFSVIHTLKNNINHLFPRKRK